MDAMQYRIIVRPSGESIVEVLSAGTQTCSDSLKVAQGLGQVSQDETTGPECNEQEEFS